MDQESSKSAKTFSVSQISISLRGKAIPGAEDRQRKIAGFDQEVLSRSKVLCIGAGGLIGHIAPTLTRKGIGALTILDNDEVEISNLNRQRFYLSDLGRNKAIALAQNLQRECIHQTQITGHALPLEAAIATNVDLVCNVAICGVDNHPARIAACRYFREKRIPVIFTAVSADADHGYVFVQEKEGPCFGCVFPDAIDNKTYPCPGTPAISEILQIVGGMAVYAVDTCLMSRPRVWNYREVFLSNEGWDSGKNLPARRDCPLCSGGPDSSRVSQKLLE
jgi:molybdopterin/thiamine biosynthesis adenylyltransferase